MCDCDSLAKQIAWTFKTPQQDLTFLVASSRGMGWGVIVIVKAGKCHVCWLRSRLVARCASIVALDNQQVRRRLASWLCSLKSPVNLSPIVTQRNATVAATQRTFIIERHWTTTFQLTSNVLGKSLFWDHLQSFVAMETYFRTRQPTHYVSIICFHIGGLCFTYLFAQSITTVIQSWESRPILMTARQPWNQLH